MEPPTCSPTGGDEVRPGRSPVSLAAGKHLKLPNTCSTLASMRGTAPGLLLVTQPPAPAPDAAQNRRLTAEEAATAVPEPKHAAAGWAALLAECAGLVLGYGENQFDATRYRQIAELCIAAGVDETLSEAWIEVGRQRASTTATLTHKACVFWDS